MRTIRLREAELRAASESTLPDAEREALERLVNTKEGRQALQRTFKDLAPGANAVDRRNPPDTRFRGITPPN